MCYAFLNRTVITPLIQLWDPLKLEITCPWFFSMTTCIEILDSAWALIQNSCLVVVKVIWLNKSNQNCWLTIRNRFPLKGYRRWHIIVSDLFVYRFVVCFVVFAVNSSEVESTNVKGEGLSSKCDNHTFKIVSLTI